MKKTKKALAIVLSLSLVFTMAIPSFAISGNMTADPTWSASGTEGAKTINYVALGDSQTNGYYLHGYFPITGTVANNSISFHDSHGFNRVVEGTYPMLFSRYLNEKLGYNVNLRQYGLSAMRCEDLHWVLNPNEEKTGPADPNTDIFWTKNLYKSGEYLDTMYKDIVNGEYVQYDLKGYKKANEDYTEAIRNADVISLALGTNSFGNFMPHRLFDLFQGNITDPEEGYELNWYLSEDQQKVYNDFIAAIEKLTDKLGASGYNPTIEAILHDMAYSLVSFMQGYDWCLEDIEKINENDATVITMGMTNVCQDITIKIDGVPIPLSLDKFYGTTMKAMNTYMKIANAKSKLDTVYVDPGEFAMEIEDIKALNPDKVDFNLEIEDLVKLNIAHESTPVLLLFGSFLGADNGKYRNSSNIIAGVKIALNSKCDGTDEALTETDIQGLEANTGESRATLKTIGEVYLGVRDVLLGVADEPQVNVKGALPYISDYANNQPLSAEDFNAAVQQNTVRKTVREAFSQPGIKDLLYVYDRMLLNAAGSHANLDGHATFAEKIIAAYNKHEAKNNVSALIKKAVPVIVGGAVVTFVTFAAAKVIKDKVESGEIAIDPNVQESIAKIKDFFKLTMANLTNGKIYTFKYI